MKALVLRANGRLAVEERAAPLGPSEPCAVVRVAACGVCGSDIPRAFDGGAYHYPLVLGHEFSGVVEEPMPGGKLGRGTRVAVFPLLPCRKCKPCSTGEYAQCTGYDYYGSRRDGGMEEFVRVPEWNLFPVPEHVKLLHAAMVEPAAVALHGVRRMRVRAGDAGAVFGAGPIGNITAQWLRIHGCRRVYVVDVDARKLDIASRMGFEPVDARAGDPVRAIREATEGEGAARVVEACGLPATFAQALAAAGTGGEVVFMGNIHGTFQLEEKAFSAVLRKELAIYGTWNSKVVPAGQDDWSTVLAYLDRELDVAPLISDTPGLEDGPEILASVRERKTFHNKVVFRLAAG